MMVANANAAARRRLGVLLVAAVGLLAAAAGRADTVNLGSLPQKDVKIHGFENGLLLYTSPRGELTKLVTNDITVNISDEAALNDAEVIFAPIAKVQTDYENAVKAGKVPPPVKPDLAAKWSDATDKYLLALKATSKPWLKDYIVRRLQVSAEAANRFDAAVSAWLIQVQKDPAEAAKHKPVMPADPKSTFITSAVKDIEAAERSETHAPQQQVLWPFLLQLYQAQGNVEGIDRLAVKLASAGGGNSPQIVQMQATGKLAIIRGLIDKKEYKDALTKLDEVRPLLVTADLQADALFYTAEAHYGLAQAAPPAEDGWRDLTLEYMKVVADFPNNAHTADALLKAAQLHEKFGESGTALQVYQAIARDLAEKYPAAAAEAKKNAERLKGATNR